MIMAGDKQRAKSISFPTYTNRRFKIPLEVFCKTFFDTFIQFVDEFHDKSTLKDIKMVVES